MSKSNVTRNSLSVIFAGDRDISVWVLKFLIGQGIMPSTLMVSDDNKATHAEELKKQCNQLDGSLILKGTQFRTEDSVNLLKSLTPDYIICVHFPYIIPQKVLEIPKLGVLNLHPAYLPYNRGWHTPTWAIWEETPFGATLHFMDERLDTGDIIHQKRIDILPDDTADTLYKRVMKVEFEVFKEAWPSIASGTYTRKKQRIQEGTTHSKADIAFLQSIDFDKQMKAGDLIRLLRALTTNDINEGAYFKAGGKTYHMQLHITGDKNIKSKAAD